MRNISFKLIFRSWLRNKTFTVISILSLAVGIACTNLLAAFVIHEYNIEQENPNKDRMVVVKQTISGARMTAFNMVSRDITSQLLERVPELDKACRVHPYFMVTYCKARENFFKDIKVIESDSPFILSSENCKGEFCRCPGGAGSDRPDRIFFKTFIRRE